jgi:hypothetical protein
MASYCTQSLSGTSAREGKWPLAALAFLLALTVARDTLWLLRSPIAVGADGYYYVIQLDSLLAHGSFYYPTQTPFILYLLGGLRLLTGDTILAVKLGSIALHALLCLGIYVLVEKVTARSWLGLLGCALASVPAMHLYMITEFIKNAGAMALLVWSAVCAVQGARAERPLRWKVCSGALMLAALLSHKSMWVLVPALPVLLLLMSRLTDARRPASSLLTPFLVLISLSLLPALLAGQKLIALPDLLTKEMLSVPRWPIHVGAPFGRAEAMTLLLASPLALFLLVRHREAISGDKLKFVAGGVALWSLLVTLNPFLNHDARLFGIVSRLDHLSYLQAAILIPCLTGLLQSFHPRALPFAFIATMLFVLASMSAPPPGGLRPAFLAERARMLEALPALSGQLDDRAIVLARHGDEFVVTKALGLASQQKFPTEQGRPVYWLLHRVKAHYLTQSTNAVMDEGMDSCLMLVRHEEVEPWLAMMSADERQALFASNPHLASYFDKAPLASAD